VRGPVNVTVTAPTVAGNLRLYAADYALPQASTVNYSAGQTRANNATVPLNASGEFTIRCAQASGAAHAIVDVNGY
jgi:heme/copper-type cytochrome/quinol oxidase subunit 2